jgi:Ca2+-binding RTX toxin-like protein
MVDVAASTKTTATLEGFGAVAGSYSGELEVTGDHDWIKVQLAAGEAYQFFLCFQDTGNVFGNAFLTLRNAAGEIVDQANDGGVGPNDLLPPTIPTTGTYYLDVGEFNDNNSGSYTLIATLSTGGILLNNGDDVYTGLPADERILAGAGADRIEIGGGLDAIGDQGNDIIYGNATSNKIFGALGADTIYGDDGADLLFGDSGDDVISGGEGGDFLLGGPGSDLIFAEEGEDVILGGLGKDFLSGDSIFDTASDTFVYNSVAESPRGALRDVLMDFLTLGGTDFDDAINLSGIDAKPGGSDNAFKFIGTKHFHDRKGELRYKIDAKHDITLVQGDVNGDGKADLEIQITGQIPLHKGDFLL